MNNRSDDVIKQLNRLASDRTIHLSGRNKIRAAIQHLRNLELQLEEVSGCLNEDDQDITGFDTSC